MTRFLVGVDGSDRSDRALEWAARRANEVGAGLTMLSVVDPDVARVLDYEVDDMREIAERVLGLSKLRVEQRYSDLDLSMRVVEGSIIDEIVEAAEGHDMVVMSSHHGATVGETLGGAKGLKVSVSVDVPCAVIPADWSEDGEGEGVLVGIGPDGASECAIAFGADEALREGCELELVSSWDRPPLFSHSDVRRDGVVETYGDQLQRALDARVASLQVQHPGLTVVGEAIEATPASRVLIERSVGKKVLVMGTHSRNALGRALFGSVCHSVLLNLKVPTIIVPQVQA